MEKMTFDQWWEKVGAWRYAEIMVQLPIAVSARLFAAEAWEVAGGLFAAEATPEQIAAAMEPPPAAPAGSDDPFRPAPQ